ncbi:thiamine phosphate synthase [Chitinophaga sp. GCM10012297]|uniref:Thiamine phosphate synthase n=1 Tax=Chitinophaga chungangae TaxID=2821488 RepID=A0ABS3YF73_9BACT|nr:thiamine phosphate synthase [Chitinophaga chungangae]MBO9152948.1 thiamine phosphate synthase [Chitinophaga chungangae]
MIWVVTAPEAVEQEASIYYDLFSAGLETLLLRKPGWSAAGYEKLVQSIPPGFRHRVMLAGYPELVAPYGLKGLHLSERLRAIVPTKETAAFRAAGFFVSTSLHPGISGVAADPSDWDYLLLGPVFDSISKANYKGRSFDSVPYNAVGIGGVTPCNAEEVRQMGFSGAALLGAVWQEPAKAVEVFMRAKELWK